MTATDIVVIGAGAAGIAAARWLRGQGQRPLVLEARSRVGGRAWTDTTQFGFPVDFGAAWLHSADVNPWTNVAREYGFRLIERLPLWLRRIGATEASPEYTAAWRAAYQRNDELIEQAAAAGRDVPVADVVPVDKHRPMFDAVMTWAVGADSDRISTVDYSRYENSDMNWAVREGVGALVARAARELDVRLNAPVTRIDWSGRNIAIDTAQGTVEARAAIITIPPTVLADESAVRFVPALPLDVANAVAAMQLGVANRVFLAMEPGALPFEGSTHFIGTDQTSHTASYQTRPSGQEVMVAYFGGRLASQLERAEQLEAFARDELARIFGAGFIARIRHTACSGWVRDPYSRGSYSVALPGAAHLRERLGAVVGERLFFAGEACSLESFGTIHGAWHSGVRAAQAALRTTAGT
jgi:monoamine oxidase